MGKQLNKTCCCCLLAKLCLTLLGPCGLTVACQAPLLMGFPRQEYWVAISFSRGSSLEMTSPKWHKKKPFLSGDIKNNNNNVRNEKHKQTSNLLLGPTVDSSRPQSESESHSAVYHSLRPQGLYCPRNCPGQNIRVGSLSLLQGVFSTQGLNPGLPHCWRILYQLSYGGSQVGVLQHWEWGSASLSFGD